jgi:hypothetical protein
MKDGVRDFNELFVPMGGETSLEKFADCFPSFAISHIQNHACTIQTGFGLG